VMVSDSTSADAQTCDEQPIGPLRAKETVHFAVFASWFSPTSFWRIGIGPVVSFEPNPASGQHAEFRGGLEIPLYVATNLLKKDAKGLVRITIGAFTSRSADGETDNSLAASISILSNATLFPSVFDQF